MNQSILDMVILCLQNASFFAFAAYPGQQAPDITEPVAAVHIHQCDSGNQTVTVEVCILSPAALGGTACELAARKAVAALQSSNAHCVQKGCAYDSTAQVYSVSILATYRGDTGEDSHRLGPGFQVYLNGTQHPWVEDFTEEKVQKQTLEYTVRSPEAVAITSGSYYWNLHLEELCPPDFPETTMAEGEFQLRVVRGSSAQVYQVCRWTSVTRSFTAQGLRRICKGIALARKEDLT